MRYNNSGIYAIPGAPLASSGLLLLLPTILIAQGKIIVVGGAGSSNRVGPAPTQPSVPPQPTKPDDLCSVEGQVVKAVTGDPVRRASVSLIRSDAAPSETGPTTYSTQSNSGEQFAMKTLSRQVPPNCEPQARGDGSAHPSGPTAEGAADLLQIHRFGSEWGVLTDGPHPGVYKAYAWEDIEIGAYMDRIS